MKIAKITQPFYTLPDGRQFKTLLQARQQAAEAIVRKELALNEGQNVVSVAMLADYLANPAVFAKLVLSLNEVHTAEE